jgi:hypothetical protein
VKKTQVIRADENAVRSQNIFAFAPNKKGVADCSVTPFYSPGTGGKI